MRRLPLALMLGAFLALPAQQANAQTTSDADTAAREGASSEIRSSLEVSFQEGVRALKAERFQQAEALLRRVYKAQPSYALSARREPAAYWLGGAHEAQGDTSRALMVWKVGLLAMKKRERVSLPLADAYLQLAAAAGLEKRTAVASVAYRLLIGSLGGQGAAPSQRRMVRPYAAQLGLILPESMRRKVGAGGSWNESLEEGQFTPEAGETLLAWWRSQDPLPATPANERMAEHLKRVAHASKHYAWAELPTGMDDRGETYVRFGAPYRKHVIRFNDPTFIEEVLRFGVNVSRGDFPSNEIWTYQNIDRSGKYIFVEEQKERYRLASAMDLLPLRLRRRFGSSQRGQNHAYSSLAALRYIYEELSLHYSSGGNLYAQVSSYMTRQENLQGINNMRSRFGRRSIGANTVTVGQGPGARVLFSLPQFGGVFPNTFASQLISQGENQDRQLARRRARAMPRQHTRVAEELGTLPVHVRTARFLEEDGTTRTEIYWSTSVEALELSGALREKIGEAAHEAGAYSLLNFTAVRSNRRYQERATYQRPYLFEQSTKKGFLAPQAVVVKGGTGLYHLALQWDQHPARVTGRGENRSVTPMAKTRLGTHRVDSLRALSADDGRLEMSDLKPMTVPEDRIQSVGGMAEAATPYPYGKIGSGRPLLLYFEIYHLTFGPDDKTHYTIEYGVDRRTERGGLLGFFRGDEEQRTSTQTTYTGQSRNVDEYILLDRSDVETGKEGQLNIKVRVTDENTGQTRERTIRFGLLPSGEETGAE